MTNLSIDRRHILQAAALSPTLAAVVAMRAGATDGPDALIVIAELVSKPEQADALRQILTPFVEGARHEPGCEHYTLLEDRQTPGRFLTYEVWTNPAALAAHMQTPAIKAISPKLGDYLAKPFTQAMLKTVSAS